MAKHMIVSAPAGAMREELFSKIGGFFKVRALNYRDSKKAVEDMLFHITENEFIVDNVPSVQVCTDLIDWMNNASPEVRLILITDEMAHSVPFSERRMVELVTLNF